MKLCWRVSLQSQLTHGKFSHRSCCCCCESQPCPWMANCDTIKWNKHTSDTSVCVCVWVSVFTLACSGTDRSSQREHSFQHIHADRLMYVCLNAKDATHTHNRPLTNTHKHMRKLTYTPTSRIRVVNDCQGRGRRYLSSIYYGSKCADAYVGALLTRAFSYRRGRGRDKRRFVFSPNFLFGSHFSLIATLSSIHIPLSLSLREVSSGSRQSESSGPWILHAFLLPAS